MVVRFTVKEMFAQVSQQISDLSTMVSTALMKKADLPVVEEHGKRLDSHNKRLDSLERDRLGEAAVERYKRRTRWAVIGSAVTAGGTVLNFAVNHVHVGHIFH